MLLWNTYDFDGEGKWFDVPCDLNSDDLPPATKGVGAGFVCKTLIDPPKAVVRGDYTYKCVTTLRPSTPSTLLFVLIRARWWGTLSPLLLPPPHDGV